MSDKINSYSGFKNVAENLTSDLLKLKEFSQELSLDGNVAGIDSVVKGLKEDTFNVAIVGEFKRGKSTLINALLGKDVLPMDVLPTTAALNKINYAANPSAQVKYKDGHSETISIDKLNDYVTKLTGESEKKAKTIKEVIVSYPVNYCKNGVTIIDTPGLNDDETMTQVTLSVLPEVDAAIMVVMAQSPFSESEKEFLEKKLITSDLGKVIFVVTGIDHLEPEDMSRVIENIRGRIQDHVMIKAEKVLGKDSKEFADYKRKIGQIKIYGLSAKQALQAKLTSNQELLKMSKFEEFEAGLEKFLTEDKGMIKLGVPVSRIKTSAVELAKAVVLKENALSMSSEEFATRRTQALAKIQEVENDRDSEFEKIDDSAEQTFRQLNGLIETYWQKLPLVADQAIDAYPIVASDLSKDNLADTQASMSKAVQNALANESQIQTERIQNVINNSLVAEAERLSDYEASFFQATEEIQGYFINDSSDYSEDIDTDIVSGITSLINIAGIGGVYSGWKQAGFKGAILGGTTAAATTIGLSVALAFLAPALVLTPWMIPIAALFGIFGGRIGGAFVSDFLVNKNIDIETAKTSFKKTIREQLEKMKDEDAFSNQVRQHIAQTFDALRDKIKTETDNVLNNTQAQLDQLSEEVANKQLMSESEKENLREMMTQVSEICERTTELENRLMIALANS